MPVNVHTWEGVAQLVHVTLYTYMSAYGGHKRALGVVP